MTHVRITLPRRTGQQHARGSLIHLIEVHLGHGLVLSSVARHVRATPAVSGSTQEGCSGILVSR